jgi:tetratricopeptide (TPR) repeat protein
MNNASLRLLLTGCAFVALVAAAPALAQDGAQEGAPVIVPTPGPALEGVEPATGEPGVIVIEAPPIPDDAEPAVVPIPAVWSPAPWTADGQSVYGLYLNGRLASFRGDRTAGAALLSAAQAMVPEQPVLADEAFREGLFAGDLDEVVRLTPMVSQTPQLAEAGRFVEVVQSFRRGDARTSLAIMQGEEFTDFFGVGVRFLKPIVAAAAGDWDTALAPVVASPRDPAGFILRLNRAQLLERRRRYDEAEAEFRSVSTNAAIAPYVAVPFGAFLERRERRDDAIAIYDAAMNGTQTDIVLTAARKRASSRRRAPTLPSLIDEGADALTFIAGGAKQAEASDLSIIYLRLAESLRPDSMTAYELGEALAKARRELPAREAFARVSPADPLIYAEAQYSTGDSFAREDMNDEALEAFRRADAAVPHQPRLALGLSGQLLAMNRTEEALAILDRPEINTADQHPLVRFQRGAALETLGRYDEAEGELWAALQAAPDNPTILNYLGYMWVDTGRRVAQGAEMLQRAHAAEPENGNIQDSLGWAQFRQGQYDTAVATLEGAVDKEPANAEINDHLGDAYWLVGRRREAEWQWNRVLTLEPDAARRIEVERKLAEGLPEPTPVVGV